MGQVLSLNAHHRVLGFFPHPDDEALGAGILLQRAAQVGATVLAVFLTSGEANSWPLRVLERTLWVTEAHRARFAARRERETAASLTALGWDPRTAVFLRWPDTGLTHRALQEPQPYLAVLRELFFRFSPTHVLCPVLSDRHPDHSLAAVLVLAAAEGQKAELLGYATHSPLRGQVARAFYRLSASEEETRAKARAIACHESQMVFRRGFHRSFAQAEELFFPLDAQDPRTLICARLEGKELLATFSLHSLWRSFRRVWLELFWFDDGFHGASAVLWPSHSWAPDRSKAELALDFAGHPWAGRFRVRFPCQPRWVAVKVHRPLLLFQEAGFTLARNMAIAQ